MTHPKKRNKVRKLRKPRKFNGRTFQLDVTGLNRNILTCAFWHWMDHPSYALRQSWNLKDAKNLHKWLGQAIAYLESKKEKRE